VARTIADLDDDVDEEISVVDVELALQLRMSVRGGSGQAATGWVA
jgi:hypothetical protein